MRALVCVVASLLLGACEQKPGSVVAPAVVSSGAPSDPTSAPTSATAWSPGAPRLNVWDPVPDVLPPTEDPPAGPRAPTTALFGARVGFTTFAEAQALTQARGLSCANKSVRAAVQAMRDAKVREVNAAKAAGKGIDSVTGASIVLWRSPRETNPQVRWACDGMDPAQVGDRQRPSVPQARLLFVFDAPHLPLRDVSLQRSYPTAREADGVADVTATVAALTAAFGAPNVGSAEVPDGKAPIPPMRSLKWAWSWADAFVKLQVVNYPSGLSLTEEIGILPKIRSDAPAMGR